ncbi:hypothetical protein LTR70_010355, partial [Exophiala xenobiotica]
MASAALGSRSIRNLPRKDYVALNSGVEKVSASVLPDRDASDTIEVAYSGDSESPLPSESVSQVSSIVSAGLTTHSERSDRSTPPTTSESAAKRRK